MKNTIEKTIKEMFDTYEVESHEVFDYVKDGEVYFKNAYPQFTAEKQIELIKYIAEIDNGFGVNVYNRSKKNKVYELSSNFYWESYLRDESSESFEEALAYLVISLNDILDKKVVKKILES